MTQVISINQEDHTPFRLVLIRRVAGSSKWDLEIGDIAVIDIDNHAAFHLEAAQTKEKLYLKTMQIQL